MEKVEIKNHIKQIRGITYGGNDSINHPKENYLPVLRSNNINEGSLNFEDLVYVPENLIKEVQLLKKGDLLITASTGSVKVIGKNGAVKNDYNGSFGAFCKVVRPLKSVNPDYLKHFFQTKYYRTTIQSVINGANINNIKNEHLDNLEIPLPPLPTQQKIAAILDKADELRQYNKQLIEKYDDLTQSLFLDMFGDPVKNEKGWEVKSIDNLCNEIVDYVNRTAPLSEVETEFIMIRTTNIKNLKLVFNETRYVSEEIFEKWTRRLLPKKGDIVFTREAPTGEVGIIDIDKKVFLGQRTMLFRPNLKVVNNYFLMYQLAGADVKQQINKLSSGSTVKHLSVPACKKFKIKVPPIDQQNQFAERVQLIETQKQQAQEALAKSEALFQSLLQQAFKGELN